MKDLIERLRSAGADGDAIYCWNRCVEAADALERLTQPVRELEPSIHISGGKMTWKNTPYFFNPHDHENESFYSAETVARLIADNNQLIAERDKWKDRCAWKEQASFKEWEHLSAKRDALQDQVKILREACLHVKREAPSMAKDAWYYAVKHVEEALAATEQKEKSE